MKTSKHILTLCLAAAVSMAASSAATAETVRFTLGTSNTSNDFSVQAMKHWQKLMADRSGGELEMNIVAGGALGSNTQILQQLSTNEIQVSIAGPAILHKMAKKYQCMEAEFVYDDADHGYRVWTGAVGKELSNMMEKEFDITISGVGLRGARQLTANKPINTPADLKGVKVRVTNKLRAKIFEAYGALPGPLPFSELYGGLRQGVFDAQENPIPAIFAKKFYEVQETLNLTSHVQSYYIVTSNHSFVEGLSEKHRAVFDETVGETMKWLNNKVKTETEALVETMKSKGLTVIQPDVKAFKKVALPIVQDFAKDNCRPGILADIAAAK